LGILNFHWVQDTNFKENYGTGISDTAR